MLLSSSKNDFLHPRDRQETLSLLQALPLAKPATHEAALRFIENHRLVGLGLGYVDVHLLAAALLTGVPLWTEDNNLKDAAIRLRIAYKNR